MITNLHRYALIGVAIMITPFVYSFVQGYWALNLVPIIELLNATEQNSRVAIIIIMNFLGAIIAATFLAFPLGYIIGKNPIVNGLLLSIPPLLLSLWVYSANQQKTSLIITLSESISAIAAFILLSFIGVKLKNVRNKST